jgi:hypothetical protein
VRKKEYLRKTFSFIASGGTVTPLMERENIGEEQAWE